LNHCRSGTPASEDGLKESPKHVRQKYIKNKLKTCALLWSLYNFKVVTDRTILADQPATALHDKKEKTCLLIDIAVPDDSNFKTK
jgi:hypothetical protein